MTLTHGSPESFHPENPLRAFDAICASGMPLFAYRLPGESAVVLGAGALADVADYDGSVGAFLVAPFSPRSHAQVIIPQVSFRTPVSTPRHSPRIRVEDSAVPPRRYSEAITSLAQSLEQRGGKTVISRRIEASADSLPLSSMYHALCRAYPSAYVYCWSLDDRIFWMGAIPELLVEIRGERVRSMALAGTMGADSRQPWDEKNREEQQMVAGFIADEFRSADMTPETGATHELQAGPVKHLCTMITAQRPSADFDLAAFAAQLSPTPAVCGLPRPEALSDIMRIETADRQFYGGYSGPLDSRTHGCLYVTLRCMAADISTRRLSLFAGGGITHLSSPGDEWNETRMKASTLLKVF